MTEDVSSFQHVASDSDSEVYCDSVDQFGAEEVRFSQFKWFLLQIKLCSNQL